MWLAVLLVCVSLDGRGQTCERREMAWPTAGQCARYVLSEYARAKRRGPHVLKEWDCIPPETRG